MTSTEENKAIVRRYEEETRNRDNWEVVDELVAPGYLDHGNSEELASLDALKQGRAQLREQIPDLRLDIEDLIAEDDRVAMRWTLRGTAKGDLETPVARFPAAGKQLRVTGMTIYRLASGKIVEIWTSTNELALYQQLGARLTTPEATSAGEDRSRASGRRLSRRAA